MKRYIRKSIVVALLMGTLMATAMAQGGKPLLPVKVSVVISRYEGDKKVSSLPYVIAVTANDRQNVSLRMGSQIPIPAPSTNNGTISVQGGIEYKTVGTNIDCKVDSTDDLRFQVMLGIEDTSVMERRASDSAPTLRTFSTRNSVVLKDGQSSQFTAAADKTTGEVVKVDVTLNVEK